MPFTAFIPVRGGSKSIPLKNIKSFCGKPLVYWVTKAASDVDSIDRITIATDSEEIREAVKAFNLPKVELYNRSEENASDTASTESVMLEYLEKGNLPSEDGFILIQATSPLLTSKDLIKGIDLFSEHDSVLSCVRFKRFLWNEDGTPMNYDFKARPRRQDFDGELMENGAFYINSVSNILKDNNRLSGRIGVSEMPEYTAVEIDEPSDWIIAEKLMNRHVLEKKCKGDIHLVLSDVDGVLTDAGMYYSESGDELKKFNTHDGMGFQLLREAGFKTGIITSENTEIVSRRAAKLKVDFVEQGKKHGGKLDAAMAICQKEGIDLSQVAYVGDDVNCKELLSAVGFAACPANAVDEIKNVPGIECLDIAGGAGAFRQFAELILKK